MTLDYEAALAKDRAASTKIDALVETLHGAWRAMYGARVLAMVDRAKTDGLMACYLLELPNYGLLHPTIYGSTVVSFDVPLQIRGTKGCQGIIPIFAIKGLEPSRNSMHSDHNTYDWYGMQKLKIGTWYWDDSVGSFSENRNTGELHEPSRYFSAIQNFWKKDGKDLLSCWPLERRIPEDTKFVAFHQRTFDEVTERVKLEIELAKRDLLEPAKAPLLFGTLPTTCDQFWNSNEGHLLREQLEKRSVAVKAIVPRLEVVEQEIIVSHPIFGKADVPLQNSSSLS